MRKRDEKIRRHTRKAQNEEEEKLLRKEILQKMSDKAKKFMEKRKAQWEKQKQKVVPTNIDLFVFRLQYILCHSIVNVLLPNCASVQL